MNSLPSLQRKHCTNPYCAQYLIRALTSYLLEREAVSRPGAVNRCSMLLLLVLIVCLGLSSGLSRPSFATHRAVRAGLHMSQLETGVPDAQRNLVASHTIRRSEGVLYCSKSC